MLEWLRAFDFICIVDQIHRFAVTQHRDFVIKHLEPWIRKAEEYEKNRPRFSFDLSLIDDVDFWLRPEWLNLKHRSQVSVNEKRERSRLLNKTRTNKRTEEEHDRQRPQVAAENVVIGKRGRPRKEHKRQRPQAAAENIVIRKRSRPRKLKEDEHKRQPAPVAAENIVIRKRGRPRKLK